MTIEATYNHDCEECCFLGTIREVQTFLVTDEVADILTAHVEGTASIADLNKALGVKPPEIHDLYVCAKQGLLGPTVIARFGDLGHEYKSAPIKYATDDHELNEAAKLAARLKFHEAMKP